MRLEWLFLRRRPPAAIDRAPLSMVDWGGISRLGRLVTATNVRRVLMPIQVPPACTSIGAM